MSDDPIVITGMGLVTPLGTGVEAVWKRLLEGRSGIRAIDRVDVSDLPTRFAGLVPSKNEDAEAGLDIDSVVSTKERKKVDLFTIYALAAAEEALSQAGWKPQDQDSRDRTATAVATGIGGFPTITEAKATLDQRGYRRLSPFVIPSFLGNLAAGNISIRYGFRGPIDTPVTACAAGLQAIGDGVRLIRSGEADVVLAGGTEACIDRLTIGGFAAARALSTRNEDPGAASRPYDRDRDGFVLGEGAGLVVLERKSHAESRGAVPLLEVAGYGTSADAYHLTAGPEDGGGAALAISACLKRAGIAPEEIGYVNGHATSTPVGDRAELAALRRVFGKALAATPISSTKSAVGHLLGAAGGVEAVFTALAVLRGMLPPTLNFNAPDAGSEDLDFVPLTARASNIGAALCNSFGFGGVNAALCLKALRA
ncbi:beta-ketoacyl-ACP synthase II [Nisaea acidiphila]|uniref:3-oxoacyl-[acyl-carrier-protein] synthase 2 n=1 Tax=Nisaea acidiphila TaxID=1862145 RepID=A0A9J7ANQ7_9PROT|nr:beta-ketoacyl-ACP synthase II [Nisaea acidiphila]UUX49048.1 beta-ketoacyl-ACP synthase II [Nisaea acidiphila]